MLFSPSPLPETMHRILDVGNCAPDHAAVKRFMTGHFDCEVVQAHTAGDALTLLRSGEFDLVVVNRKLDADYSDGLDVVRQVKADPALTGTPVMLITNYAEHQDAAEACGAVRGFGKLEYGKAETRQRVAAALSAAGE